MKLNKDVFNRQEVMNLKMNILPTLILMLISLVTSSCGDLFSKKREKEPMQMQEFATCKMDNIEEAFSKILEANIKGDILCLQQNLHVFLDVVRTDKPGYLNKERLKVYLEKNEPDMGDIDKIIDGIYDLSFLMFGGDRENIHRVKIDELVDFLIYFNEHVYQIYYYFSSETNGEVNFSRHESQRQVVFDEATLIANKLEKILVKNRISVDTLDMVKFVDDFFNTDENQDTFKKIKSLLFSKRVFFGGTKTELTYEELHSAVLKLPALVQIVFDVARLKNVKSDNQQQDMLRLYLRDIYEVKNQLHFGPNDFEEVMNIPEALEAVELLLPDLLGNGMKLSDYSEEIMEVKKALLGYGGPFITSVEIFNLIDHADSILTKGTMFYKIYDHFRTDLDSYGPVTRDFRDFPVYSRDEEEMLYDFARIANEYKFFKGSFDAPVFSHEYHRNADGFFEIMSLEYVVKLLFAEYGRANPLARGGYDMTMENVIVVINKLKYVLKDIGLINIGRVGGGEIQATADNLVLMSTLFQYQSDGCDADTVCMEVPELTEFAVGLITAMSVKKFFTDEMKSLCGSVDEFDRIDVSCFRQNFITVLERPMEAGKSLADYMPKMYQFLQESIQEAGTDSADYMKFITETEAFTRTCSYYDDEQTREVPMKADDAFAVFAGLLNLESTLLRFDTNHDNRMNGDKHNNEVLNAYYEVYEGAIRGLVAPNGGFMEKLAKPIFQYLVKYGKVPDTSNFGSIWSFAKFLLRINKRADASRTTIATILKTLGDQGETSKNHPFKCEECLTNPEVGCDPEDMGTWSDWCERYPERAVCQGR